MGFQGAAGKKKKKGITGIIYGLPCNEKNSGLLLITITREANNVTALWGCCVISNLSWADSLCLLIVWRDKHVVNFILQL